MTDRTETIQQLVQEKFEALDFIPLRLENAFDPTWWDRVGGKPTSDMNADLINDGALDPLQIIIISISDSDLFVSTVFDSPTSEPVQRLRSYISALPTHTAIDSTIHTLIRILLLYTARSTRSSHLLLGTSLTSLSINLISTIAQGGGFSVREEAQEEWRSDSMETVRLIRPLQEITMKECSMWAWWNNLRVVGKQRHPGVKQGIGALTKGAPSSMRYENFISFKSSDFIVGLERDYPSTVSTIARTCAKLAPRVGASGSCILCERRGHSLLYHSTATDNTRLVRPLQPGVQEWESRISIRATAPSSPSHSSDSFSLLQSLTPYLCYSCHATLMSRSSKGVSGNITNTSLPLPVWASARLHISPSDAAICVQLDVKEADDEIWLARKVDPNEMKAAIGEFLLV